MAEGEKWSRNWRVANIIAAIWFFGWLVVALVMSIVKGTPSREDVPLIALIAVGPPAMILAPWYIFRGRISAILDRSGK